MRAGTVSVTTFFSAETTLAALISFEGATAMFFIVLQAIGSSLWKKVTVAYSTAGAAFRPLNVSFTSWGFSPTLTNFTMYLPDVLSNTAEAQRPS